MRWKYLSLGYSAVYWGCKSLWSPFNTCLDLFTQICRGTRTADQSCTNCLLPRATSSYSHNSGVWKLEIWSRNGVPVLWYAKIHHPMIKKVNLQKSDLTLLFQFKVILPYKNARGAEHAQSGRRKSQMPLCTSELGRLVISMTLSYSVTSPSVSCIERAKSLLCDLPGSKVPLLND